MTGPRLSVIPARAVTDPALKPRDLQVLCVLGTHTDELGWCRKSQVKMARAMGCARSTVFEAIERLVTAGYVERYVQEEDNGRDSPHVYRVVLDPVHPCPANIAGDDEEPVDDGGTPADIPAPPAGISAPPAGPGPAPKNDSSRTIERERGRTGGKSDDEDPPGPAEDRRTVERAFELAFRAWPTSISDSRPEAWKAWLGLSADERLAAAAEAARYVEAAKAAGRKHVVSHGVYLREKRWTQLPPREAEKPQAVQAPPFGKLWAVMRMRDLLRPAVALPRPSPFIASLIAAGGEAGERERLSHQARHGWPQVNRMHNLAAHGVGIVAEAELDAPTETVKVGSALWEAWRAEHERRGWPWLPDMGKVEWVQFPAGGPEGLDAFALALRGETETRQAAE